MLFVVLFILFLFIIILIGVPIFLLLKLTKNKTYHNESQHIKYCSNCGTQLHDTATVCSVCGTKVSNPSVNLPIEPQPQPYYPPVYQPQYYRPYPIDGNSTGLNVLSFLFPFIGLILYLAFLDEKPIRAKGCGKWGLIGFISGILLTIFLGIIIGIAA